MIGINALDQASKSELEGIRNILEEEVPRLRRLTAAIAKS